MNCPVCKKEIKRGDNVAKVLSRVLYGIMEGTDKEFHFKAWEQALTVDYEGGTEPIYHEGCINGMLFP